MRSIRAHHMDLRPASPCLALIALATAALGSGSCVDTRTDACERDRLRCGVDQLCVSGQGQFEDYCAPRIPAQACIGLEDEGACSYQGVPLGFCRQGSCVPAGCGNGFTDTALNEACDDGNNEPGDGCSADCLSNETCGNSFIDFQIGERCDDGNALSHDGCASGCLTEERVWKEVSFDSPPVRTYHAMAYDAGRGRLVLFGGDGDSLPLGDTWEWDGSYWTQLSPLASPPARYWHAMAYDAERARVVLFGGVVGSRHGETWEWDGARWTQLSPPVSPTARYGHAMAYDAARARVVLFGGTASGAWYGDTWEWDGAHWTQLAPQVSPPARYNHAMAYDAARGRVVLFGGVGGSWYGDTWEWDGAHWTKLSPAASPTARAGHAMAYDTGRGRLVLFGGARGGPHHRDTWEWDGARWTQLSPPTSPTARGGHAMAYDAERGRVTIFGGTTGINGPHHSDTWEWDGERWTQPLPPASPPARSSYAMAYDAARARVVLFGGLAGSGFFRSDTWEWDGVRWTELSQRLRPQSGVGTRWPTTPRVVVWSCSAAWADPFAVTHGSGTENAGPSSLRRSRPRPGVGT